MAPADLNRDLLQAGLKIFHFGSITLIQDPLRATTLEALRLAQAAGALISYDPNLREPLWPSLEAAKEWILFGLDYAHIVKVSAEELRFLTETPDIADGVAQLWRPGHRLMVVTRGAEGCMAFTQDRSWPAPGFAVPVADTIGAGDGFVAGLLAGILRTGPDWLETDLRPLLRQANAVGALTASRPGGIPALPTNEELKSFLVQA
jgi:fructokinase